LVFLTYAGVSVVSGLGQMLPFTRGSWTPDRALIWRLIRYTGWQAAANIFAMINLNQGSFELGFFKGKSAAGVFAVGLTLSLSLFAVYNAFFAYALPHAVRLTSRSELNSFLARFVLLALLLASLCVPLVWAAGRLAPSFFPTENGAAITAFDYLAASVLLAVIQAPLEALSQRLLQPRLILICWLARVVFSGSLGMALILSAQTAEQAAVRAAFAQFAGAVPALVLLAVLVSYAVRTAKRAQGEFACAA
jgi:O-antigen/teichoic acid export membrane protein